MGFQFAGDNARSPRRSLHAGPDMAETAIRILPGCIWSRRARKNGRMRNRCGHVSRPDARHGTGLSAGTGFPDVFPGRPDQPCPLTHTPAQRLARPAIRGNSQAATRARRLRCQPNRNLILRISSSAASAHWPEPSVANRRTHPVTAGPSGTDHRTPSARYTRTRHRHRTPLRTRPVSGVCRADP